MLNLRRKFILRVEILAGIIIGSAAAAVAVAFILLLLIKVDLAGVHSDGASVTAATESAALLDLYTWLLWGFGILTLCLVILSFAFSKYLGRKMLTPLREILSEAETFKAGSGANPEMAGASFHELIELLNIRDRELKQMKEVAEARADRAEERASIILSTLGSAVFSIDTDDNLTLFNRESAELFNLSDDDIGRKFPCTRSKAGEQVYEILRDAPGNQVIADIPFQIENEGSLGNKHFSVTVSKSGIGEYAVLINDTTRISELERSTADQKTMADIGAASAGISHEMGNTLCALQGFIHLLARGHSDERTAAIIDETRREVNEAQNLIASLRGLSDISNPITNILPVADVIEICQSECQKLKIDYTIETSQDCKAKIAADNKLLGTVIRNILSNANDSCDKVSVSIDISCKDDNFIISVKDNGSGLQMDSEEIFRPFSTTRSREGNMGLGLTVSRRIIRSFEGDIYCRNRKPAGTEFIITLPIIEDNGQEDNV